ncbi:MAG: hypothetical protein ACO1RX_20405 [Candidatus Sericytochromatia bacterium]
MLLRFKFRAFAAVLLLCLSLLGLLSLVKIDFGEEFGYYHTGMKGGYIEHPAADLNTQKMPQITGKYYREDQVVEDFPREAWVRVWTEDILTPSQVTLVSRAYRNKFDPQFAKVGIYFALKYPPSYDPDKYYAVMSYSGPQLQTEQTVKYADVYERMFLKVRTYLLRKFVNAW